MWVVLVLAVLAYWLLGDEPSKATPPAPTVEQPAAPPAAGSVYTIGGTPTPLGNPEQLGGASVERYHRAHRLVPAPPPCGGGPA